MSTSPTVNPLGYQGVHSPNPPAIWFRPRDPDMVTFKDFRNYQIGDEWQNTVTRQFFKLVSVSTVTGAAQGIWYPITYYIPGVLITLTSDVGIATPALGTITVAGGNNINTSAAGATLTINVTAPVTVPNGGTGQITLLDHGVVVGRGVAAVDSLTVGNTGELLVGATGANPAFGTSANGNFTFTTATAGTDRALTVSNTDNSAAVSAAHLQVTVGGSTSTGDPYTNYSVTGGGTASVGIDNSDSDKFKITTGASPSAGTELLSMSPGLTYFSPGSVYNNGAVIGGVTEFQTVNTDTTNANSSARFYTRSSTGGGDAYIAFDNSGTPSNYLLGNRRTSGKLVITVGYNPAVPLINGTELASIDGTGDATLGASNANTLSLNNATQGTVGAAGGASALPATPSGFLNININGTPYVIPYYLPV